MIRKAKEQDLPGVAEIYDAILAEEEAGRVQIGWVRDIYPTEATARDAWEKGELYVSEEDGRIVAAGKINQEQMPAYRDVDWAYPADDSEVMVLHTLVVAPDCSGRGIGRRFLDFYESFALEHGCRYLRIDTNQKNSRARLMYQRRGYLERGIIPCNFNGIEGVQLVCLEKRLETEADRSERFARTELLLGAKKVERLGRARVAIFGIGGVGGYVAEALARSGVGFFLLVDHDRVSRSNINRQIIATEKTVGRYKVEVMRERILDINPQARVEIRNCFYLPENAEEFDFREYTYIVDAVDTVTAKLEIILQAQRCRVPVISSMGAGNKLDPTAFRVADIYKTTMCPLAKVMRRELKKRGVKRLKVVYSTEPPVRPAGGEEQSEEEPKRKAVPGSVAFVPSVAGLVLASEVVKDLISGEEEEKCQQIEK